MVDSLVIVVFKALGVLFNPAHRAGGRQEANRANNEHVPSDVCLLIA